MDGASRSIGESTGKAGKVISVRSRGPGRRLSLRSFVSLQGQTHGWVDFDLGIPLLGQFCQFPHA